MPQTMKQYMAELKLKDPTLYKEIIEESDREIEEIRKSWGGKRPNAGRKPVYADRVGINKRVSKDTVVKLKDYSKTHKISENEALDRLIDAGYKCLKEG
jgi:hypothetical protein